jgi:CheY-like chemotaxis protein
MTANWQVLVIDDEDDVHDITKLALKRKTWRDRPLELTHAKSAAQARSILSAPNAPTFHCALVDVVMESNDAGLELCDFIRSTVPRTTRIVLRTGQPGAAPPEKVMNDYDIDYYLAKTEVTEERLFTTVRACFRSSLDIAALIAVSAQLRAFTFALQEPSTSVESLTAIMRQSLRFLEEKYAAKLGFVPAGSKSTGDAEAAFGAGLSSALEQAQRKKLSPMGLLRGTDVGLGEGVFFVMTTALRDRSEQSVRERVKTFFQSLVGEMETASLEKGAGIAVVFDREMPDRLKREFLQDLELFISNWKVAANSLELQDRIVRDRLETMKNFTSR